VTPPGDRPAARSYDLPHFGQAKFPWVHLRAPPRFPDEAVEVLKRLVEPLPQVLELLDALPAVLKELVDPLQDNRPA